MDSQSVVNQKYAELRPKRFIDLCDSIQQLYEGPWVIMGNCPEDGCHNPNPADQEKARQMWRNTYALLKPYEEMIYKDYQEMGLYKFGYYQDEDSQSVRAMYLLCEAYHNNVELWDFVQQEPQAAIQSEESTPTEPSQVVYDMRKAIRFLADKEKIFKEQHLPIIKERLERWCNNIPVGKRKEAIDKKLISYRNELQKSGFFEFYGAEVPPGFYANVVDCVDSQWELDRMCADEQFACDLDDLYDGIDVLNIEKLERYIWVNQNRLSDDQIYSLLTYEEATRMLPELLPTDKEVMDDAIAEMEKNGMSMMPFDDDPPAEELVSINTIYTDKLRVKSVYDAYCKAMTESIITKVLLVVKGQKRSKKWRWPHVYDALKDTRLGYIGKDAGITDFGYAMKELNATLKPVNVTQRLKDKSKDYPTTADKNIITDIVNILKPESQKK